MKVTYLILTFVGILKYFDVVLDGKHCIRVFVTKKPTKLTLVYFDVLKNLLL